MIFFFNFNSDLLILRWLLLLPRTRNWSSSNNGRYLIVMVLECRYVTAIEPSLVWNPNHHSITVFNRTASLKSVTKRAFENNRVFVSCLLVVCWVCVCRAEVVLFLNFGNMYPLICQKKLQRLLYLVMGCLYLSPTTWVSLLISLYITWSS